MVMARTSGPATPEETAEASHRRGGRQSLMAEETNSDAQKKSLAVFLRNVMVKPLIMMLAMVQSYGTVFTGRMSPRKLLDRKAAVMLSWILNSLRGHTEASAKGDESLTRGTCSRKVFRPPP